MELIRASDHVVASNDGVTLHHLMIPANSASQRISLTLVVVAPGARNEPHRHASSEQAWVALRGRGELIVDGDARVPFIGGDVVRFVEGDLHGFENTGDVAFEYLSVTSPPVRRDAAAPGDAAAGRRPA